MGRAGRSCRIMMHVGRARGDVRPGAVGSFPCARRLRRSAATARLDLRCELGRRQLVGRPAPQPVARILQPEGGLGLGVRGFGGRLVEFLQHGRQRLLATRRRRFWRHGFRCLVERLVERLVECLVDRCVFTPGRTTRPGRRTVCFGREPRQEGRQRGKSRPPPLAGQAFRPPIRSGTGEGVCG